MNDLHLPENKGLRAVALFEALKGSAVLFAGFGLLTLVHRDAQLIAEQWVTRFHLNPASRVPRIFIETLSRSDAHLYLLAAGAAAYSLVRFVEAYGLWRARVWAEWFAALSGGIYLPIELYEWWRHPRWLTFATVLVNMAIVFFMLRSLRRSHRRKRMAASSLHASSR